MVLIIDWHFLKSPPAQALISAKKSCLARAGRCSPFQSVEAPPSLHISARSPARVSRGVRRGRRQVLRPALAADHLAAERGAARSVAGSSPASPPRDGRQ